MSSRVAATTVAVLAALALAGCGSSTSGRPSDSTASTPSSVARTAPSSSTAVSSTAVSSPAVSSPVASSAAPAAGPVTINKNFANPDIGESGTVLKLVRNFPVSAASKAKYPTLNDEEVVLVEVTVHSSSKYYDSIGSDSFFLLGNDNEKNSENDTVVATDLAAARYPVLQDAETGTSSTGWMAFLVDKGFSRLTLRYYTLAATTTNGKTIPAKNIDIRLV